MRLEIIVFCCVFFTHTKIIAGGEIEAKRGQYPFMSIIYYSDDSIVDDRGSRFLQGAVLIKPSWLVTTAIEEHLLVFPQKTLIARVGAVGIDANFTFNEDEDEQEREVIEIVTPSNRSISQWWYTDITLLKTLLPFKMTKTVANADLQPKHNFNEKICNILVFVRKYGNWSDEKTLMQFAVDLIQPSTKSNCGIHFREETMICAQDTDDSRHTAFPQFCHGNKGGPLICEGEVMGLQTYVDMNCKEPYLYQVLSAWDKFITCGTEQNCLEEECAHTCVTINKDVIPTTVATIKPTTEETIVESKITQETVDDTISTFKYVKTWNVDVTEPPVKTEDNTLAYITPKALLEELREYIDTISTTLKADVSETSTTAVLSTAVSAFDKEDMTRNPNIPLIERKQFATDEQSSTMQSTKEINAESIKGMSAETPEVTSAQTSEVISGETLEVSGQKLEVSGETSEVFRADSPKVISVETTKVMRLRLMGGNETSSNCRNCSSYIVVFTIFILSLLF